MKTCSPSTFSKSGRDIFICSSVKDGHTKNKYGLPSWPHVPIVPQLAGSIEFASAKAPRDIYILFFHVMIYTSFWCGCECWWVIVNQANHDQDNRTRTTQRYIIYTHIPHTCIALIHVIRYILTASLSRVNNLKYYLLPTNSRVMQKKNVKY